MEQCWDANPIRRPESNNTLRKKIRELTRKYFQNNAQLIISNQESSALIKTNNSFISSNYSSKIHQFTNLPEPRNATEGS